MNALHSRLQVPHGEDDPRTGEDEAQMALFPEVEPAAAPRARSPLALPPGETRAGLPGGSEGATSEAASFSAPETTFGERIVRAAYAMGVPANLLVAPFSRPAKARIKATVEAPLLGDRVAGMALRAGHFLVGGTRIPLAEADFAAGSKHAPLTDAVLHGFAWLRDLAACAPAPQCAATAERVLRAWLAANTEPEVPAPTGPWSVETAGRRLLAWLVHAPLVLGNRDKAYHWAMLDAIGETARWLDRNAGKAADAHGEVIAFAALTAAGLLLPEGKPRRLCGEAGLVRALGETMGEDGGVLSRSPLAQADLLATLVELAACYRAIRREPPQALLAAVPMLVPPLVTLAHADGSLGNWQGAGSISAERVEALVAASGARARPLRQDGDAPSSWGYQRLEAGEAVLVCDTAPPPLGRHARSGCASTLAFEFSHGEHLLIVNCGGAALAGGQVPLRIEQGLRASAAHSTLVLGDANSTAVLIGGNLGKGVGEVEVERAPVDLPAGPHGPGGAGTRIDMAHDGYAARFGLLHRRSLALLEDGSALVGEDRIEPANRRGGRGKLGYAIRFHLGPQVDLRLAADGHAADLLLPDGGFWRFSAGDAVLGAEESVWVDGNGCPHGVQQIVIEGLASRGGEAFAWVLRQVG